MVTYNNFPFSLMPKRPKDTTGTSCFQFPDTTSTCKRNLTHCHDEQQQQPDQTVTLLGLGFRPNNKDKDKLRSDRKTAITNQQMWCTVISYSTLHNINRLPHSQGKTINYYMISLLDYGTQNVALFQVMVFCSNTTT